MPQRVLCRHAAVTDAARQKIHTYHFVNTYIIKDMDGLKPAGPQIVENQAWVPQEYRNGHTFGGGEVSFGGICRL